MTTIAPTYTAPRLILHFDVNKTIINSDSVTGKTKEEIIINQLAETTVGIWGLKLPKMTYKEYVYKILFPGDDSNLETKTHRREAIKKFMEVVKQHPTIAPNVFERYKKLAEKANESIFTSFINLIEKLQTCNLNFKLILRTFGDDLAQVKEEISQKTKIVFLGKGKFDKGALKLLYKENKTLTTTQEIFQEFVSSNGHMAIQDDYKYWHDHKQQAAFGKKFVFDNNATNLSLFFDDNLIGESSDSSIVAPYTSTGHFVPTSHLMNTKLFCVDVEQAILDDAYYIKLVNAALQAHGSATRIV